MEVETPVLKKKGIVKFPVSYKYNGGITIDGNHYDGYSVGAPVIPDGCELVSLGIGLNMNNHPPFSTMLLKEKDKNEK